MGVLYGTAIHSVVFEGPPHTRALNVCTVVMLFFKKNYYYLGGTMYYVACVQRTFICGTFRRSLTISCTFVKRLQHKKLHTKKRKTD